MSPSSRLVHGTLLALVVCVASARTRADKPDEPNEEETAPPAPTPAAPAARPPGTPKTAVLTGRMDDDDSGGDGQARFEAALAWVRGGREREAAEALLALTREMPNDDIAPEALFEAAQLYEERLFDPGTAERLYGELRNHYPQSRLFRRAQGRHDELALGMRSGAPALAEFNDIVATYRTTGIRHTIERLQKLLSDHPDFALGDRALYLLGTAQREAQKDDEDRVAFRAGWTSMMADDAEAQKTLRLLLSSHPQSQWAPRAAQVLGEIHLAHGDYAAARTRFASLRGYGGPLWTGAADEGIAQCDRTQRRARLALVGIAFLLLFGGWLGVRGRRHLWPPSFEVYYYVPVAAFLVFLAYLSGGGPVGRTVLYLGLSGALLIWLSAAASIAAAPGKRTRARTLLAIFAVLWRALAAAVLLYLVVYYGGLSEMVLETLRNGPESG